MNILMLGRWLPPPRRPVKATREYQFARHLARRHRLTLGFVTDNPDSGGAISALRSEFGDLEFAAVSRAWKSLGSALRSATGESCTLSYFRSEALRTRLADRVRKTRYDVVLVSSSGMIQYGLGIDRQIPLVVDFGELDSEWWADQAAQRPGPAARFFRTETARLRIAETAAARRAARCVAGSVAARTRLQSLAPEVALELIQNGVDIEYFGTRPSPGKTRTVVFSASLNRERDRRAAAEFYRQIVPIVRASAPDVRFVVAGKEAPLMPRRLDLGGAELIAPVADLRPFFHSECVAVAPFGTGSELLASVLEPMAAGVPMVATAEVHEALAIPANRGVTIAARDHRDFAVALSRLLEDSPQRSALGERGRAYVTEFHGWNVMGDQLTTLVERAVRPCPVADSISTDLPMGAAHHVPIDEQAR
jgi:glycosyltransferase involved in cell wall biosynthesis